MARRPLYWLAIAVAAPAMLGAGLWAATALWVRLIPASMASDIVACLMVLLTLAAMICLGLRRWRVVVLWGVAFAVILSWWAMLTPSNDRAWAPDIARTAHGVVESDRLVLHNVRNFVWRSDTNFDERWETRTYDLGQITGADLFMSYWAGEAIAHTILSFGFTDGQHLAFSIEIRKEKTESYSALAGFFRTYELAMIAADERDVVGVRTNVRGEDVRLYRLRMPPDRARALLQEYVGQANALHRAPQFYNSLTTNCTTQIFRMVRALQPGIPLDYRMLLAGFVPDYVYDRGGLDTRLPFETLREKSHIKGRAASSDPDFSSKIREGVPSPVGP
jgi:hypothetical protein